MKRKMISWLFGDRLSGRELALNRAAHSPQSIYYLLLAMRLLAFSVMFASAFHLKDQLPILGPWLGAEWWHVIAILVPLLLIPEAVEWLYRRRAKSRLADHESTLNWPQ